MKILGGEPKPASPNPRQEVIRMRDDLLKEIASKLPREKERADRTKKYSDLKMFWNDIKRQIELIASGYEQHWGKARLAAENGLAAEYSPIDPFLNTFQEKFATAFHTGDFNPLKNFWTEEMRKIEAAEAASKGHPPEYHPE